MFMQSAAMALGFGSFFQYGKRKVSAMSNEEFNVLTPEALTAQLMSSINNMIPTVQQSFHQMEQMNEMILQAMAKYFDQAVGFLDRWITQRGQNFVNNIQSGIVDPISEIPSNIEDFYKNQIANEDFGTAAGADSPYAAQTQDQPTTITLNAYEQWASRWINYRNSSANFSSATVKELRYMLNQISTGQGGQTAKWRTTILKWWEKKTPKPLTIQEQYTATVTEVKDSGVGEVQRTAILYANVVKFLAIYSKRGGQTRSNENILLGNTKFYNQYVQSIRKRNLTIDTAKLISQKKIIPRY